MSYPIPLHTAGQLERALDAQLQRAAARGAKGWVMRIVAYFACQYARAVIALLEGLLAEYRAGTLVLPELPDGCEPRKQRPPPPPSTAANPAAVSPRPGASRRVRAPWGDFGHDPRDGAAGAPEPSAARRGELAPHGAALTLVPPAFPLRRAERAPRGVAGYPCLVPRPPAATFGSLTAPRTHAHFVAIS